MAEIDKLEITIVTSVREAKKEINILRDEISKLSTSLDKFKKSSVNSATKGASNQMKNQMRNMVSEYKKGAKTMSTIREQMFNQPLVLPNTYKGLKRELARQEELFRETQNKVLSAQKHKETDGKAYRTNVEQLNNSARLISAIRNELKGLNRDSFRALQKNAGAITTELGKTKKTMDVIRDGMREKPFISPKNVFEAQKMLDTLTQKFNTAKSSVLDYQRRNDTESKVYRNNVEKMYEYANAISKVRGYLKRRQEDNLADATPEQKAFMKRMELVKAGKWDYAKEAEEEAKKRAQDLASYNEQLASSYDQIERSASKASYSVKFATKDVFNVRDALQASVDGKYSRGQRIKSSTTTVTKSDTNNISVLESVAERVRNAFARLRIEASAFKQIMIEKGLASGVLSYTQDFVALQKSIAKAKKEYDKLTIAMKDREALGKGNDAVYRGYQLKQGRLKGNIASFREQMRAMKEDGSAYEINTKNAQKSLDQLKSAFNRVKDSVKKAVKAIGSFILKITGINKASKKAKDGIQNVTKFAKKLSKELLRVGKMAKLMITRMAIRKVLENVGNGFQSLALHSEKFNSVMSNLINSSKTLGYSISGMIAPLIQALAPALMYIIELVTKAVNALNQLFSALTGAKTWSKAKKFTDSWSDSIKGANGSAKELKKTVLGFDELNQLQDSSSSGGGGTDGITDMFEDVEIDPKWLKLADDLKKMWENGNFYELGKMWGENLRDVLESIPWDKIRDTSNKLGKSLASLINGFIEVERLAYDIGNTIAQGINTVFEFINGFVHELNWSSVGNFIADTFNGFFEGIDWDLIKDTLYTGIEGVGDAINAFVRRFNWDNISEFISNAINTIAETLFRFIKRVRWEDIARELGNQINKSVEGINWKLIGKTIGSIIQKAIDFIKTFIKTVNWKNVIKAIKELIEGFFEEVKADDIIKILIPILVLSVGKSITGLIKSVVGMKVGSLLATAMFGGSTATSITTTLAGIGLKWGGAIAGGIALGLGGGEIVKDVVLNIGKALGADAENIENVRQAYDGWGGSIRLVKEGLQETWYKITGNDEKLAELNNTVYRLTDENGNYTRSVDRLGNTIIEWTDATDKANEKNKATIDVYDNLFSSVDSATQALVDGADRVYDISVKMDGANQIVEESVTLFPKLGDNTYKASTAQESFNLALDDFKIKLQESKAYSDKHKTTLDVIREAQEKNTIAVDQTRDSINAIRSQTYPQYKSTLDVIKEAQDNQKTSLDNVDSSFKIFKDTTGQVTLYLKDNKDAFDKDTTATSESKDMLDKYTIKAGDTIKVVQTENENLKINKDKFDEVKEATKNAKDNLSNFKDETVNTKNKIPDMTKGIGEIKTTMKDAGTQISTTSKTMRDEFSSSKWDLDGVSTGLGRTFSRAIDKVKEKFKDMFSWINSKLKIQVSGEEISLGKVGGYATGGFPEDGLFYANHNELVGKFSNGKTAVANNKQIIDGIQAGVFNAVTSALATQQSGNAQYISNTITLDGQTVARSITKLQNRNDRRYNPQTT